MTGLLTGLGLGFGVAAGFGPINVLCLATGLRHGFRPALGVGLGAATVDGFYALLAGVGAAALLTGETRGWLEILGGVALVVLAMRMAKAARREAAHTAGTRRAGRSFVIALTATAANPLTIVSWAAVFTGVVPGLELGRVETLALLPAGIFVGSLAWFAIVSAASALAARRLGELALRRLSLAAALAIAGFGAWLVFSGSRAL